MLLLRCSERVSNTSMSMLKSNLSQRDYEFDVSMLKRSVESSSSYCLKVNTEYILW